MSYQNYSKLKAKGALPDPDEPAKRIENINAGEGFEIIGDGHVFHYRRVGGKNFVSTSNVEFAVGIGEHPAWPKVSSEKQAETIPAIKVKGK